ncbi:MAG: hypothetical protein SGI71_03020 [Verrucomicrobiota bacterium]|nr:hypothetical protein [Verrucomicrobiota bacterium]
MSLKYLLNSAWLFHYGEPEVLPPANHAETYLSAKAGGARDPAGTDWDDLEWNLVTLPHDFLVGSRNETLL